MVRATTLLVLLLAIACSDGERTNRAARSSDDAEPKAGRAAAEQVCDGGWRDAAPGLRHRSLCSDGEATLHQVEVDLSRWELDAVRVTPTTAPAAARDAGASFAINANFFDPERRPLGVVVSEGAVLQRPHPVSWQSIFHTTSDSRAAIVLPEKWPEVRDASSMAVQAGPRLLANGAVTGATRGSPSLRSGICLTADDRVIFFATTMRRLVDVDEMTQLAARSEADGGLGCRDAMLFDGGPSAQMFLSGSGISIAGEPVPVFVIARSRADALAGRP